MTKTCRSWRNAVAVFCLAGLASCGGGGGNPLDNPADVGNPPPDATNRKLSFAYFQRCINPILLEELPININGVISTNTCAGAGCHADSTGTGGSFRVIAAAADVDLDDAANTPDTIRASDMYKNFYSAQGAVVTGSSALSRLLTKPRLLNVLHGGGLIFETDQDPHVRLIHYWITHPMPQGQDEFSAAADGMFDPVTGTCNTQ